MLLAGEGKPASYFLDIRRIIVLRKISDASVNEPAGASQCAVTQCGKFASAAVRRPGSRKSEPNRHCANDIAAIQGAGRLFDEWQTPYPVSHDAWHIGNAQDPRFHRPRGKTGICPVGGRPDGAAHNQDNDAHAYDQNRDGLAVHPAHLAMHWS